MIVKRFPNRFAIGQESCLANHRSSASLQQCVLRLAAPILLRRPMVEGRYSGRSFSYEYISGGSTMAGQLFTGSDLR
jgi:hypothetical protein